MMREERKIARRRDDVDSRTDYFCVSPILNQELLGFTETHCVSKCLLSLGVPFSNFDAGISYANWYEVFLKIYPDHMILGGDAWKERDSDSFATLNKAGLFVAVCNIQGATTGHSVLIWRNIKGNLQIFDPRKCCASNDGVAGILSRRQLESNKLSVIVSAWKNLEGGQQKPRLHRQTQSVIDLT